MLLLAGYVLAQQLLLQGYVGLANNGDFAKVARRFDLAPPEGWGDNFLFFVPDYEFADRNYWVSPVVSSEIVLAGAPIVAVRAAGATAFNIRWLGALNALLFLVAFAVALLCLRRAGVAVQILGALAILWILGDVVYVAYFNSFYSDSAAIVGLLLAFAAAVSLAAQEAHCRWTFAVFAVGALLFVTSKSQHGLFVAAPVAFAIWIAWRARPLRVGAAVTVALLLGGCAFDLAHTPETYAAQALFNVIFFKLTPQSATPLQELRELGVADGDARYIGTHAFMAGSPVDDPVWAHNFVRRSGYGALGGFYLRHPQWVGRFLAGDLEREAPLMRPRNLSNFPREYGHPPGARTDRFASWSELRSWLFQVWPWHIALWLAMFLAGCGWLALQGSRLACVGLGTAVLATGEFCLASLADGAETYRHLLIFHLLTDLTILMAVVWGLDRAKSVMLRSSLWQN